MPDNWVDASQGMAASGMRLGGQTLLTRQTSYFASEDVPAMLAGMTGGLLFHNTNNLGLALREVGSDEND